ncbi:MAG TPA: NAD(P)-dependent oxidoreductase [Candidatus Marinimicrobia bacterium]|nr:NAD(P)-dependent oxidoreductase [Candidatus Neomarinimicrobiota bacterium]HRS50808.1 NAD(P)-dependent oxidoreductase [Candidatus Neomarinimicrobiota bacterium]
MKVLVTGATGFIGQHLIRHLLAENCEVRALCRTTSLKPDEFAQRVEWQIGDLTAPESLATAVADCDLVFHLAGAIKALNDADFTRINVSGTVNLLEALQQYGKQGVRLVFVSSLSASGPSAPWSPKNEDEPCYPVSAYGQSKLEAEIEVLKRKNRIWSTIIRPAVVYGPGDRESLAFFKIAKSRFNPHIGLAKRYVSMIYVSDLVDLLWKAAVSDRPSGEIYFACDEQSDGYEWNQVIATAGNALDYHLLPILLPQLILPIIAESAQIISKITGKIGSLNRDKYREMSQTHWTCTSAKAQKLLAFKPQIDLSEGFQRTAQWYREQNWI